MRTKIIPLLLASLLPLQLLAWGAGHDAVNELAVELLHGAVPKESEQDIVKWSHTPDGGQWDKLGKFKLPPEDTEFLKANKLGASAYVCHSAKGQAACFILLVNAFKANAPDRVAFWSACLLHALADEAACNHDPLIHYATYAFMEYKLKTGKGVGLDFADVAQDRELVRRLAAAEPPRPLPDEPEEALLAVMMSGLESDAFMTRRGSTIAASFALDATAAQIAAAKTALAELGVHGAAHGRDVILAAKDFARRGVTPQLTPELMAEFQKRKAAYGAARPLADDSLWADLLPIQAADSQRAIGVLVEPSVAMNEAKFSFGAKLILAASARSMTRAGVPFRLVDVRHLELNPRTTPVLLVCAGRFGVDKRTKAGIAAYSAAGGKLLWIGGEHAGLLGKLSENLVKADPALLPVSCKYGKDTPVVKATQILFLDRFKDALGDKPYRFVHSPNTKAGWQVPQCPYQLRPADGLAVLAELRVGEATLPVAGAWQDKAVFLPEYLVAPYLLSDEDSVPDLSRPALDQVGRKLLLAALAQLGQK